MAADAVAVSPVVSIVEGSRSASSAEIAYREAGFHVTSMWKEYQDSVVSGADATLYWHRYQRALGNQQRAYLLWRRVEDLLDLHIAA